MDCKCETCVRTDCKERTKQDDLRIVVSCNDYLERKTTNADRIRAMSDEELADVVVCPHTGNWDLCRDDCKKCRLEWLKQPVKENDNG